MFNKATKLSSAISRYNKYCEGYYNTNGNVDGYILSAFQGIGKTSIRLSHSGSDTLDGINAFDLAEVDGPYIGQINMITVSSFCGPQGLIWGYDIARSANLYGKASNGFPASVKSGRRNLPVYSAFPLIEATKALLGTVRNKKYIIKPGSHVPCAGKNIKAAGPARVYSALAIAIAEDRENDACLLMEDVGHIPYELKGRGLKNYENMIATRVAESTLGIEKNQRVKYKEVFVGVKSVEVKENEIACALVACPYINLARNAILKTKDGGLDFESTVESDLKTWKRETNNE